MISVFRTRSSRWLLACSVVVLMVVWCAMPPRAFPTDEIVHIKSGMSMRSIAQTLKDHHVIRSRTLFQLIAKGTGSAAQLQAGDYNFENKTGVIGIVTRIAKGQYGDVFVHLTIPEGSSLQDIANIATSHLPDFNTDYFIDTAVPYNGYLFPDTYFILPSTTEDDLIAVMRDEFSKKLTDIVPEALTELSPEDLRAKVIMASILEREANGEEDIFIISGILWKRMQKGIPLQVDASFAYLLNKESSELTLADLKIDSPYNTYTHKGLPPGPLGNPGSLALDAAFHPAASPYLYYLHDAEGKAHFGKTFAEHVANKRKYLK